MSAIIKEACSELRRDIENLKVRTKVMFDQVIEAGLVDIAEARANMKLAYRHLEDARMRFGKVIQAIDGGVSRFDKDDKAAAIAVAGEAVNKE